MNIQFKNHKQKSLKLASLSLSSIVIIIIILSRSFSSTPSAGAEVSAFTPNRSTAIPATIMSVVSKNNRWSTAWDDILSGGNPRWKISSEECHNRAYEHFHRFVPIIAEEDKEKEQVMSVFCPLAGDDPFVLLLYKKGYHVTAIDLVPEAIEAMKKRFDDDGGNDCTWTKNESLSDDDDDNDDGDVIWTHKSGRVTLIVGDALKKRSYLNNSFDAVYDKDSFGALPISMRKSFCNRISEYTKVNGILYLECKLKQPIPGTEGQGQDDDNGGQGPPFSLTRDDLMEDDNYGGSNKFEYVEGLGVVYELAENFATMKQTGHILRRCTK